MIKKGLVLFYFLVVSCLVTDAYATYSGTGEIYNNSNQPWIVSTKSQKIKINNTTPFTLVTINPHERIKVDYEWSDSMLPILKQLGKIEIMDYKKQIQKIIVSSYNAREVFFVFDNGFENIINFQYENVNSPGKFSTTTSTIIINGDSWV